MSTVEGVSGLEITGARQDRDDEVLTPRALELIALLHRELNPRRLELLAARQDRVRALAAGDTLRFLPETAHIRDDDSWQVAEPAPGLVDRRVEMTGPTDRKMTINALNSGAKVWLADHEDANTPLWENVIGGQLKPKDALPRALHFTPPPATRLHQSRGQGLRAQAGRRAAEDRRPTAGLAPAREAHPRRRRADLGQ